MGERYVQEVKNIRRRCPSVNVCGNLLKKLHQGKSLESIASTVPDLKTYRLTANRKVDEKKRQLVGNVHVYKDKLEAIQEFYHNTPVSILAIAEEKFGMLFYEGGCNRGVIKYLELRKRKGVHSIHYGLRYWKWRLTGRILDWGDLDIHDFAVLLPKRGKKRRKKGQPWGEYTIMTKEWSPAMLEHYHYSLVGLTCLKKEENKEEDGWV